MGLDLKVGAIACLFLDNFQMSNRLLVAGAASWANPVANCLSCSAIKLLANTTIVLELQANVREIELTRTFRQCGCWA